MIIIKLQGGLGNQLFQIFTLISLSIDNDMDFTIFEYKDDKVFSDTIACYSKDHYININSYIFIILLFQNY